MKLKTAKRLIIAAIIAVVVAATISTWPPPPPQYEVTDLGSVAGSGDVWAINNTGQAAGFAGDFGASPNQIRGFVWDPAHGRKVLQVPDSRYTIPVDINNKGQVVGRFVAGRNVSAFMWNAESGFTKLGTLGGNSSSAQASNNEGQVVGCAETPEGILHAFIWDRTAGMRDLGALGGQFSDAKDINEKGQVVGEVVLANGRTHAFVWREDTGMVDLGTLGGPISYARGINNDGQVVGSSMCTNSQSFRGFVWDCNSGMTELNIKGQNVYPQQINGSGQIIGKITTQAFLIFPARETSFVWDSEDGVVELDGLFRPKGSRFTGTDINNKGQIVGIEVSERGERHAVILTPKTQTASEK